MAASLTFRGPRYGDIAAIWPHLREIEKLELAAGGRSPKEGVRISMRCSTMAWTVEAEGRAVGMFGVAPVDLMEGIGRPWFLSTAQLTRHPRLWLLHGRDYLARIEAAYPKLENMVHADNALSIRWLAKLGFDVKAEVVQVGEQPFRHFTKGL